MSLCCLCYLDFPDSLFVLCLFSVQSFTLRFPDYLDSLVSPCYLCSPVSLISSVLFVLPLSSTRSNFPALFLSFFRIHSLLSVISVFCFLYSLNFPLVSLWSPCSLDCFGFLGSLTLHLSFSRFTQLTLFFLLFLFSMFSLLSRFSRFSRFSMLPLFSRFS